MSSTPLVLFDFDGTLADSIPAVCVATNAVLARYGRDPISESDTLEGMRHETTQRIRELIDENDPGVLESARTAFYRELEKHHHAVSLEPGMIDLVRALRRRGWKTGVVSNNSSEAIKGILAADASLFDMVLGEFDMENRKPHPEGLLKAIQLAGGTPVATAYIGDGDTDSEAARRAGVFSVGVTWVHRRYGASVPSGFPRLAPDAPGVHQELDRWFKLITPLLADGQPDPVQGVLPGTARTGVAPRTRRLIFMRHCESRANEQGILAARQDFPLSDRGTADARLIAQRFFSGGGGAGFDATAVIDAKPASVPVPAAAGSPASVPTNVSASVPVPATAGSLFSPRIDRIFCSPLTRAQQTAQPFAAHTGLPVMTVPALIEHDLGVFSGLTFAQTDAHPDYRHDKTKRWNWKPDGGESYQEIYERLLPFFFALMTDPFEGTTLCVTHAVTMRMIEAFLSNTIPRYPVKYAGNGEMWEVDFSGPGREHTIRKLRFLDKQR